MESISYSSKVKESFFLTYIDFTVGVFENILEVALGVG